jgi:hypothetical protein
MNCKIVVTILELGVLAFLIFCHRQTYDPGYLSVTLGPKKQTKNDIQPGLLHPINTDWDSPFYYTQSKINSPNAAYSDCRRFSERPVSYWRKLELEKLIDWSKFHRVLKKGPHPTQVVLASVYLDSITVVYGVYITGDGDILVPQMSYVMAAGDLPEWFRMHPGEDPFEMDLRIPPMDTLRARFQQ